MQKSQSVKVAWIAPYPVQLLESEMAVTRYRQAFHPCSWIVTLSEALAISPEIDFHLITQTPAISRSQSFRKNGITFHVLKGGIPYTNRGYPPYFPLDVITRFRFEINRYRRAVSRIQPDIVHAHGTEGPNALAALSTGKPCLTSIQGIISEYYKTNPNFRFRVVRRCEQEAVRRGHYFTCRTNFDAGFVRSLNAQARIFTIHEAMRPIFFRQEWQPQTAATILYVGSLEERKGLPVLLEAFRAVVQTRPSARLTVIGGGDRAKYEQCCRAWGIEGHVRFLGFQSAERIAAEHLAAQVFVLPSDNENSPNALAEAMVTGMPVVATAVGGIPSMVEDGRTGLLVSPRQPQALCQAICRLLDDAAERERFGHAARLRARQRHDPAQVAQLTIAAYREILAAEAGKQGATS